MAKTPCPSDYRSGDELNSSSPYYEEPNENYGKDSVEFPWSLCFDPPHPQLGEEVRCILKGFAEYCDTEQHMSAAEKRGAARAAAHDAWDGPDVERQYKGFDFISAELPDGRTLSIEQLEAEPGFGTRAQQLDEYKGELLEAAEDAIDNNIKTKKEVLSLRASWAAPKTTNSARMGI